MDERSRERSGEVTVEWRRIASTDVPSPVVRRLPYLEVKLEHAGVEPTSHGDRFFPDAVPYAIDGRSRVFYWRPALASSSATPDEWTLACATSYELVGFDGLPAALPPLVTDGANGATVVVDGTIGGDATTTRLRAYDPPAVRLERVGEGDIELTVAEDSYTVDCGERRRVPLRERRVEPVDADGGPATVTPELVVRYPGRREIHHPAPDASYRLFPSFGLSLDDLPDPLPVPTAAGELDHDALATSLGVDRTDRPYPERVLWQAFAYTAFDPHAGVTPELAQLDDGHLALRTGSFTGT